MINFGRRALFVGATVTDEPLWGVRTDTDWYGFAFHIGRRCVYIFFG
jgi:hypothetical protein